MKKSIRLFSMLLSLIMVLSIFGGMQLSASAATTPSCTSLKTSSVKTSSVRVDFTIKNPSKLKIEKCGMQIRKKGASSWNTKNETIASANQKNKSIAVWYTVGKGKEFNYTLSKKTAYEYRGFCKYNGKTYYSSIKSFTTKAADNPYPWYNTDGRRSCTSVAWQKVYDNQGIALPNWGNAGTWYDKAKKAGYPVSAVGNTPKVGWIVVWKQTKGSGVGHVAYITKVDTANKKITFYEGGYIGTSNGLNTRSCSYKSGSKIPWTADGVKYEQTMLGYINPKKSQTTNPSTTTKPTTSSTTKQSTTSASTSASMTVNAVSMLGNTSARLNFTINNPKNENIPKCGVMISKDGNNWTTLTENVASGYTTNSTIKTWYEVGNGKELNYTLSKNTTYYYKAFFITSKGVKKYSAQKTFKTANVVITNNGASSISESSATIKFKTTGAGSLGITQAGVRIKKASASSWAKTYTENVASKYKYYDPISTTYVIGKNKEVNYTLASKTKYAYQPWVKVNGITYYGSTAYFTTK